MADVSDELAKSSALTREDLLKRGAAAAFAVGMFGALPDKALGFYGPLRYKHKQQAGELRIMTWAHFVPAYDTWLDGTYAKQWGEANDVEVKIDHINNALLFSYGIGRGRSPERSRPVLVHLAAVVVPEAGRPRQRPRPGGHEEGRARCRRWPRRASTTRGRSSSSASRRRTRPTRCSTAGATCRRPGSASTPGTTCARERRG